MEGCLALLEVGLSYLMEAWPKFPHVKCPSDRNALMGLDGSGNQTPEVECVHRPLVVFC
jgi:hypothetical protein